MSKTRHARHYSLAEANAALPEVEELLGRLRSARDRLGDREARAALADAAPTNGGGAPGRVISEGFLAVREALTELRDREIVLRDLDRGLVDFPTLIEGREAYLCWEQGEPEIGFWHEPEAGFAGRRRVDG